MAIIRTTDALEAILLIWINYSFTFDESLYAQ